VEVLRRVIATVPDCDVVWTAGDGQAAIEQCAADTPDLILMDVVLPVMDGAEATRHIMAKTPCAVVLVTSVVLEDAPWVFEAMRWGALDVVSTPTFGDGNQIEGAELLRKKILTVATLLGKSRQTTTPPASPVVHVSNLPPLIVIGSSTGGPKALSTILPALPSDFAGAVIVVQHMEAHFVTGMTKWLDGQCSVHVRTAQNSDTITPSNVLVAAGSQDLEMSPRRQLEYVTAGNDSPYHPSINAFFQSVASNWGNPGTAVLLSGMGSDGAEGMMALRQSGWMTIAQDQATSAVYGMPKAANERGAATHTLAVDVIAPAILRHVASC
jgi:two-component system, chemotaxis family, response regulator WspF